MTFFLAYEKECATLRDMALRDAISVRFDEVTKARLDALSEQTGLSSADLVRRAVEEFLDRVEHNGHITIPISRLAKATTRTPRS